MINLIKIYTDNPNPKTINLIINCLNKGGVIIYPTDTVYAIGCLVDNLIGLNKIIKFKSNKKSELTLSFLFKNISSTSKYLKNLNNTKFKIIKKYLPGPYAFILESKVKLPNPFQKRKKLGVRISNHPVTKAILDKLDCPIITSSLHDPDNLIKYTTDPDKIFAYWRDKVDLIIDSGNSGNIPSTVVDLTYEEPIVLRRGKGEFI